MTEALIDHADSGEIPRLPGEHRTRIDLGEATRDLRSFRRDTTEEHTENLAHHIAGLPPRRRPVSDVTAEARLIDAPLGLAGANFGQPRVIDLEKTAMFGVVYNAAATVDGELRPAAPGPLPTPLPPDPQPAPEPEPAYTGRHRLTLGRRVRRFVAGMGVVGAAVVAIWAGLILAAAAVFL